MTEFWPTFHDLMVAYKNCRLHKPASHCQAHFELRLGENLLTLHREIHTGKYRPSPAKCFVVTHPKPREIFAADFRDRVIHHLIVSQLEPLWEKKFIYSSFACRVRKGSHGAIKYAQAKVRKISQGGSKTVWALQFDVEKYFVTIHRRILCELLLRHFQQARLLEMIALIYTHDARRGAKRIGYQSYLIPPGRSWFDQKPEQGIAIGNLSSQFGANVYLSGLDHFIQRELRPLTYLRYMDDGLLFDTDPEKLRTMPLSIDRWLRTHRAQRLNPGKTHLTPLRDGIDYLGYRLRQVDSPSEPLEVFSEPIKKWRWVRAVRKLEKDIIPENTKPHPLAPFLPDKTLVRKVASLNSRLGVLRHCRSYLFRKESLERLINNTTLFKNIPREFADPWCPLSLKKGYQAIRLK